MLSWCAQIGASASTFQYMVSGRMLRLPSLNDVFVAENGQLLVGNTVFEPVEDPIGCGVEIAPELDISNFFKDLLSSVLSLENSESESCAKSFFQLIIQKQARVPT